MGDAVRQTVWGAGVFDLSCAVPGVGLVCSEVGRVAGVEQ